VKILVRPAAVFALFSGLAAFAGCGGGGSPGLCGAPKGQVALVYPAPGSTGIPDGFPGIVLGSTNGLGPSYDAVLQQAGTVLQVPQGRVALAPTPLPSPYLLPAFPNPIYQISAARIVLLSGAKYQVYLNDSNSNCGLSSIGSFTAQ